LFGSLPAFSNTAPWASMYPFLADLFGFPAITLGLRPCRSELFTLLARKDLVARVTFE
jgi:hypothetical protein